MRIRHRLIARLIVNVRVSVVLHVLMIEASQSSSYGTADEEAERSDTTDSRRREERGMMSDTDDDEPQNETRYSIQISPPKGPPSMLVVKSSSACQAGDDELIKGNYL